jgi:hypothetical protein
LTKFFGFSLGQRRLTLTLPVPGPFLTRIITFFTRPAVGSVGWSSDWEKRGQSHEVEISQQGMANPGSDIDSAPKNRNI